jgi:hypothetical protein
VRWDGVIGRVGVVVRPGSVAVRGGITGRVAVPGGVTGRVTVRGGVTGRVTVRGGVTGRVAVWGTTVGRETVRGGGVGRDTVRGGGAGRDTARGGGAGRDTAWGAGAGRAAGRFGGSACATVIEAKDAAARAINTATRVAEMPLRFNRVAFSDTSSPSISHPCFRFGHTNVGPARWFHHGCDGSMSYWCLAGALAVLGPRPFWRDFLNRINL